MNRAEYRSIVRCYGKEVADLADAEINFLRQTEKVMKERTKKEFIKLYNSGVGRLALQHCDFNIYYPYSIRWIRSIVSFLFPGLYLKKIVSIMNLRTALLNKIRSDSLAGR